MNSKKQNYIFVNLFDASCHTLISVLIPALSIVIQFLKSHITDVYEVNNLLVTGFFFFATYFYDFYSRFRDCNSQSKLIITILHISRNLYFMLSVSLIVLIIIYNVKLIEVSWIFNCFGWLTTIGFIPFLLYLSDIIRQLNDERKNKIVKATL